MKDLPGNVVAYKRTPDFTDETMPAKMNQNHTTLPGVWATIVIHEGELEYTIPRDEEVNTLTSEIVGIVEPEVEHSIRAKGPVRFYVEFYRDPADLPAQPVASA